MAAADTLMRWDMHRGTGLKVHSDADNAVPDAVVVLTLGPVRIPCRVVYVIDEANRQGFAYGTLDGHPESGEELFYVDYSPRTGRCPRTSPRSRTPAAGTPGSAVRWASESRPCSPTAI